MRNLNTLIQPPLIEVRLKGHLGRELTEEPLMLRGWSPAEVIALIRCNFADFDQALASAEERGVGYRIYCGDRVLENDSELDDPVGSAVMTISPVPVGSGGVGRLFLGAALIGGSFLSGGTLATVLLSAGLSQVATSISKILSPQPRTPGTEEERKQSALFDSASGQAEDSDPIFLHYGEGWVSGKVLSQSITTEDL